MAKSLAASRRNNEHRRVVMSAKERLKMREQFSGSADSMSAASGFVTSRFVVWLLGILALISAGLIAAAGKPATQPPDLSGIWQGLPIQSLSPSDPSAHKPGAEGDIPY